MSFWKFLVSETMVLKGLGKNYGDRVGRESIDEAIRGPQGPPELQKTTENRPNSFQTNPKFDPKSGTYGSYLRVSGDIRDIFIDMCVYRSHEVTDDGEVRGEGGPPFPLRWP